MRGRRRDPAAVAEAKAPVRSRQAKKLAAPAAAAAPQVAETTGKAPSWLRGDGLALWQKLGPMLRGQRLLQAPDEQAFARYCRNSAKWAQLREALDKRGYTYDAVTTQGGKLRRVDPAFMVADRLERQLLAIEDRFGMNPAERQRINAQRAAGAGQGGLPFDNTDGKRQDDAATTAAPAAEPIPGPVGMLN